MEQVAASRTPIPGVLKPMENRIGVRERPRGPRTMLSPEMKRTKTVVNVPHFAVVVYPKTVPIPSKRVIKALYEASLEEGNKHWVQRQLGPRVARPGEGGGDRADGSCSAEPIHHPRELM